MAKLTAKQQRFVEEYLIDLNATQAAIRAGYKETEYTDTNASKLLENTRIKRAVSQRMAEQSRRTGVTADRVIMELAKIAFANAANIINPDDASVKSGASRDDSAAIQSVKVKTSYSDKGDMVEREVKLYDKLKALELLGKHLGMFKDNVNVTHEEIEDDGFLDALSDTAAKDWSEHEENS